MQREHRWQLHLRSRETCQRRWHFPSALKSPSQGEQREQNLKKCSACIFKELDQKSLGPWEASGMRGEGCVAGRQGWKTLEGGQKKQVLKVPVCRAKCLTSQRALQVPQEEDETLCGVFQKGILAARQADWMRLGRKRGWSPGRRRGRSPREGCWVLGWETVGQWAQRVPFVDAWPQEGEGRRGWGGYAPNFLGWPQAVSPTCHVTLPYFPGQNRLIHV